MKFTTTFLPTFLLLLFSTSTTLATIIKPTNPSDLTQETLTKTPGESILGAPVMMGDASADHLIKRAAEAETAVKTPNPKKEKADRKKMLLAAQKAKDKAAKGQGRLKFNGKEGGHKNHA